MEILPEIFQSVAYALPLVYIFEETRNILVNEMINYDNIFNAFYLAKFLFLEHHKRVLEIKYHIFSF